MPTVQLPTLVLAAGLDPWDRQPGETTRRYDQFRVYLDAGRGRTLRKASETLTLSADYVRHVAAAYRWVERAETYDRHRDDLHEKVWLEERRKAAENDARLLNAATAKVAQRLTTLLPEELEPADLVRMLDVVMRHRRGLFGDPTALTVAVTGPTLDPLTARLAELTSMTADQRRAAIAELAASVQRRSEAAAGGDDDE